MYFKVKKKKIILSLTLANWDKIFSDLNFLHIFYSKVETLHHGFMDNRFRFFIQCAVFWMSHSRNSPNLYFTWKLLENLDYELNLIPIRLIDGELVVNVLRESPLRALPEELYHPYWVFVFSPSYNFIWLNT